MNTSNRILSLFFGLLVAAATQAATPEETTSFPHMPMMNQGRHMMMNPQMMQQSMTPEQLQNMPMYGQQGMNRMMQQMPHMGYGYGMPMMGQGMGPGGGNMPMHPMMMQMMQMRMQHMQKMEQHLANIESLLAQMLEAQKAE